MAKEVLLYGEIYDESASEFIHELNEAYDENQDITIRVNTEGGDPQYGWGIVAKISELKPELKIDGKAYSFGAFLACYFEDVEALDVSEFMFHRAAYPAWVERDADFFTEEVKSSLQRINKNFETALRNKIDVPAFEEMKGIKVKDIFSMDSRIDVFLSAQEAKKIGLINKITKITPAKRREINTAMYAVAAKYDPQRNSNNIEEMDFEELKTKFPNLYAQAKQEGVKVGKQEEKDRVSAWMQFIDVDPGSVTKAIEGDRELKTKDIAEFGKKMLSENALKTLEKESPNPVDTSEDETKIKTAQEKEIEAYKAQVKAELAKYKIR